MHPWTLKVLHESAEAGKIWAVTVDKPRDHRHLRLPDEEDPLHDNVRKNGLWGAIMAGAWGTEWYFGYEQLHSDLSAQGYRSRDRFWDQGKFALILFVNNNIPVQEMQPYDELISSDGDYVLADPGNNYVVYLKNGREVQLNLEQTTSSLNVHWYNPRIGDQLIRGSVKTIIGPGM